MTGALERFLAAARAAGLDPDVHRFPEGTKTARAAAAAVGCDVGQIVKSLVFRADDEPILAFTSGANRVDTEKLARVAGARMVRRATPEEARSATGFAVGGTPPLGHPKRLRAWVDPALLAFDRIWAAAGTPNAVFPLSPRELLACTAGAEADFVET